MFLTIFFLVVVVGGGYLVYIKYFRDEDANANAEQDAIVSSADTTANLKRRVNRRDGRYYDYNDDLITDLFLIALLDHLLFDENGYAYPDEALYEQATTDAFIDSADIGEPPVLTEDGLTADEQRTHDAIEESASAEIERASTPEPVRETPSYSEPERSYGGGGSSDSGSSDSGGGGGSDD